MENRTRPAVRPAGTHTGRSRRSPWIQTLASLVAASALLLLLPAMPAGADGAGAAPQTQAATPLHDLTLAPHAAPANLADLPQAPTDGEAAILAYINEARTAAGLAPVAWDPLLSRVARSHALDMIANRYFGHISATDGTPARRANKGGVRFTRLGENLAGNSDLADAHRMLMDSPTHRANILDPDFQRVGLAVVRGGPYGLMIVEEFIVPAPPADTRPVASESQPGRQQTTSPAIASTLDAPSGHAK